MCLPNKDWELHQDVDGNIMEIEDLKSKIFRGGIEHNIRFESIKPILAVFQTTISHYSKTFVRGHSDNV